MITPWNKLQKAADPVSTYIKKPAAYVKPYFKQLGSTGSSKFNVPFKPKSYLDQENEDEDLGSGYRSTNKATQSVVDENAGWVANHPHAYDDAMLEDKDKDESLFGTSNNNNDNAPFKLKSDDYLGKSMKDYKLYNIDLLGDFGVNKSSASLSGDAGVYTRADENIKAQLFADQYENVLDTYKRMQGEYQSALKRTNGLSTLGISVLRLKLNKFSAFLDDDKNKREYDQSLRKIKSSQLDYLVEALDRTGADPSGNFDPTSAALLASALLKMDQQSAINKIGLNKLSQMSPQQQQLAILKLKRTDFIQQLLAILKNAGEDYDKHTQDLKWWLDNYKISKGFADKKQAYANSSIFNPHYWQYEVVGTMGSSYADAKALAASMGLGAAGMVAPLITKGPVGWAAAAALGAGEYLAKRHSSEQENNAEVGDRLTQSILDYLNNAGVKEKIMPSLRKAEIAYKKSLGFSNDDIAKLTDNDAIRDAYMNKIDNRSSILKTAFTKSLPGSNEQFNRDMATTAFSDLLETSIDQVGLPIGKLVKTIGGKLVKPLTNVIGKALDNTTIGDMTLRDALKESTLNSTVLNAVKRVAGEAKEGAELGGNVANATSTGFAGHAIFDTTGALFNAAGKELYRALPDAALTFARRSKLALDAFWQPVVQTVLPKSLAARTAGKFAYGIAKNTMVNMLNEGAEEGKQYINSLANSKDYYMGQESSLYSDLWKDFLNGMAVNKALLSTIGLASSPYENDQDFWLNWKGGAVLGGLHTSAMAVATHTYPIIKQMLAENVIGSNLAADRMDQLTSLLRGKIYAQAANAAKGYSAVSDALDHLRSVKESAGLEYGDDYWNNEKQLAERVYKLQTNKSWRSILAAKGVNVGSDEFNTLTSIHANTDHEQLELQNDRLKVNSLINQILNSNGITEDAHTALNEANVNFKAVQGMSDLALNYDLNHDNLAELNENNKVEDVNKKLDEQGKTASYIGAVSLLSRLRALLLIDNTLNTVDQYKLTFKLTFGTDVVAHDAKNVNRYVTKSIQETSKALKSFGITLSGDNQSMYQLLQEQSINPGVEAQLEKLYHNSELLNSYNDVLQKRKDDLISDVKYDKNTDKYSFTGKDTEKATSHKLYQKVNNVSVDNDMFYKQAQDILTNNTESEDNPTVEFKDPIREMLNTLDGELAIQRIKTDKYLKRNPYLSNWLNKSLTESTENTPIIPVNKNNEQRKVNVDVLKQKILNHKDKIQAIRTKHRGEATAGLNLNNLETLLPIANLIKDSVKLGYYSFKNFVDDVYSKHQLAKLDADDIAHLMSVYTVLKNALSESEKSNMQDDMSLMSESILNVLDKLGVQGSDGTTKTQLSVQTINEVTSTILDINDNIDKDLSDYYNTVEKNGNVHTNIDAETHLNGEEQHIRQLVFDVINSNDISTEDKVEILNNLGSTNADKVLRDNRFNPSAVKSLIFGNILENKGNQFARLGSIVRDTMQSIVENGLIDAADEVISGINDTTLNFLTRLKASGLTVLPVTYKSFYNGKSAEVDFVAVDLNGNIHLIDVVTKHTRYDSDDINDNLKRIYQSRMTKMLELAQHQLGPKVIAIETIPVKVSYDFDDHTKQLSNAKVDKLLNTVAITTAKEVSKSEQDGRIEVLNDNIDYLNASGANLMRVEPDKMWSADNVSANISQAALIETAVALTQNEIDAKAAEVDLINSISNTYTRTLSRHPGVTEETDVHNVKSEYIHGELLKASEQPDFIVNSTFEVDGFEGNRPTIKVTYKGRTYDRIPLDLFKEDSIFLDKFKKVVDFCKRNPQYKAVVIGPKRTNGIMLTGEEKDITTLKDWFDINNPHITLGDNSNGTNDSKIGFIKLKYDSTGNPIDAMIVGKDSMPLYTFQGNVDDSMKIPGLMVYLMKQHNMEDPDGKIRYIPVALKTEQFSDDQYNAIIDMMVQLCREGKSAVNKDGILINDILPMFMQFSNSMFYMSDPKFEGVRDRIAYLTKSNEIKFGLNTYRLIDYDGNLNEDAGTGINALKQALIDKLSYIQSDRKLLSQSMNDNNNKLFKQIKQVINTTGKSVTLMPGYTFDKLSISDNSTLLSWMVGNNKISTNFNGLSNPRVSISDVRIEQKIDVPTTSEVELVTEQLKDGHQLTTQDLIEGLLLTANKDTKRISTDRELLNDYFKQLFGDDFLFDAENSDVLELLTDGDVLGRATTDGITIANTAIPGIQYHEAFHRTLELLESEKNRNAIYNRYRLLHGKNLSDREVAEGLANMYMEYRISKDFAKSVIQDKSVFSFRKLFSSMYNFARFSMLYLTNRKLLKVFLNMDANKYRGTKVSNYNRKSFEKRFGKGLNYTIRNSRTNDTYESSAFTSNEEVNEMSEGLAVLCNMIHNALDKATNRETPLTISSDTPLILFNSEIGKKIKQSLIHGNKNQSDRNIKCFNEVFHSEEVTDNDGIKKTIYPTWNAMLDKINTFLSVYLGKGHNEITDAFDTNVEDAQSDNTETADIGQYTKNSYEYSQLSRANQKVKLFFGTVLYKQYEPAVDGLMKARVDMSQNMFNLPRYIPLAECFNKVLNDMHDVKSLDDLYSRMKYMSDQGDLIYMSLFDKFDKLYQKYLDSKNNDKIDYDAESQLVSIYTTIKSQKMKFTFVYSRTNSEGSYLEVKDTDFDRDSIFHAQRWVLNLITGQNGVFHPVRATNGHLYFSKGFNKIGDTINKFNNIIRSIGAVDNVSALVNIDGTKLVLSNSEDLNTFKRKLVDMFNVFGIDLSTDFINYQLIRYYGSSDASAIYKWLTYNENKDGFNSFLNRLQLATVNKNGILTNSDGYVKETIASAGFLSTLSSRYAEFLRSKETLDATLAGNKKGYLISLNNTLSDTVDLLNGDINDRTVQNMLGDNYNITEDQDGTLIGSLILKLISSTDKPTLTLLTPVGFKTEKQADQGVAYTRIPEYEDYVSKMEYLSNSNIIFPTLSDKSTYAALSGIKLPGISFADGNITKEMINIVYAKQGDRTKGHYAIFPDDILNQMVEYAKCERSSIVKCMQDLGMIDSDNQPLADNQKVVNFHTKNKLGVDPNGTRFASLIEIFDSKGRRININDLNKSSIDCLKDADTWFFNQPIEVQRHTINTLLNERLQEELQYCLKVGVINRFDVVDNEQLYTSRDQLSSFSNITNIGLNEVRIKKIYDAYIAKYSVNKKTAFTNAQMSMMQSLAIVAYIADNMAKSIISIQESERIFSANPLFCKWKYKDGKLVDRTSDEIKRLGGLMSTGTNNLFDLPGVGLSYTCAEIKDVEVGSTSEVAKDLHDMFLISKLKDKLLNIELSKGNTNNEELVKATRDIYDINDIETLKERIGDDALFSKLEKAAEEESSAYTSGINVADGASYITAKMAAKLLRLLGLYDELMDQAFHILTDDNSKYSYKNSIDAWSHITDAILGTQKYSAYGHRYQNGVNIPYYNKTALFPMFPSVAYGRMHDLYDKMDKEGVDMVMMDSAVKVGSQGAIKYEQLGNSPFNVYTQDFSAIRKQLNTDPNDKENLTMGTQALKVGLANLRLSRSYKSIDGKEYTGELIRDGIMHAINRLSAMGREKVMSKFMNKDGLIDILKFADFVKDQLSGRDADRNLLDALVIEDGEFTMPIEATSSLNWMQSILVSEINKSIIDVLTPGHAFYQRSVLGMEGFPSMMSQDEAEEHGIVINGGKKLQMINSKDHSMDCVLSIDYFESLVPKKKVPVTTTSTEKSVVNGKVVEKSVTKTKYINQARTFEESKQWLIDNKIIGDDAIGNMMVYRIPTQAQSSIHAMRCVDVIPAVKDTIILPEEFTKITGSDFDIDKLFLNRLSYKIEKDGSASLDFNDDQEEYYQNLMLNGFLTLLKDTDNSIGILDRSIDNDTKLITDITDKIPTEDDNYEKPYKFYTLSKQCKLKTDLSTGKAGIGPYALNNNSLILTQLYNVGLDPDISDNAMLKELGATSLAKYEDRDGNSIMSWIGAFINAHVDMAKDPYVSKINVNPFTYNISNLLIRTGFGKQGVCFLCSPILKAMARGYANGSGMYLNEDKGSVYSAQQDEIKYEILHYFYGVLKDLMKGTSSWNAEKALNEVLKEYLDIDSFDEINKAFPSIYLIQLFKKYIENGTFEKLSQLTPTELADKTRTINGESIEDIQKIAMCSFYGLSKSAKSLSDLVKYCKIDTKKLGKSLLQLVEYTQGYDDLINSDAFINLEDLVDKSFIGNKTKMSLNTLAEVEHDVIMSATPCFLSIYKYLKSTIGISRPLNETESKSLERSILTNIKSKFFSQDYVNNENERRQLERPGAMKFDIPGMFYGDTNMAKRLNILKMYINNDQLMNQRLGKNELLRNLIVDDIKNKKLTFEYPALIRMLSGANGDKLVMDNIIQAWDELLNDSNPDVRNFANDLAVYAFFTSGDNVGYTKFFNYVPNSWRINSGYADYMKTTMNALRNVNYNDYDVNTILINNWFDRGFVRHFKTTSGKKTLFKLIDSNHIRPTDEKMVTTNSDKCLSVIAVNDKFTNDVSKIHLYVLQDYDSDGPIYGLVTPQSLRMAGGYSLYENGWSILPIENVNTKPIELNNILNMGIGPVETERELPVKALSQTKARQEEYSKEMQDILDKASRDSKGNLLAPNGKKSNLTERQYAQVRTKAFKDWFGDWEKTANSNRVSLGKEIPNTDEYSKYGQKGETDVEIREVLDENDNIIGTVRMEFSGKGRKGVVTLHPNLTVTGKGYGTALYQHIADIYNINVEESFGEIGKSEAAKKLWNKIANTISKDPDIPLRQLTPSNSSKVVDENGEPLVVYHGTNVENISIFDRTKISEEQTLVGTGTATFGNFFSDKYDDAKSFANVTRLRRKSGKATIYDVFLNIKNPMYFETLGDFRKYSSEKGHYNDNGDFVSDVKLPKEYDGVIVKRRNSSDDSKEFVAPSSNQIKSVTGNTGGFSTQNDDIRYREAFNTTDKLNILSEEDQRKAEETENNENNSPLNVTDEERDKIEKEGEETKLHCKGGEK